MAFAGDAFHNLSADSRLGRLYGQRYILRPALAQHLAQLGDLRRFGVFRRSNTTSKLSTPESRPDKRKSLAQRGRQG
jgi:hypothetical protein